MTDTKYLKKRIKESGMTVVAVAQKTGILRETLYNRLKAGDFKISEICALSSVLRLDEKERNEIFFGNNSE